MAKVQNQVTPYIRSVLKLWLADIQQQEFTVYDACQYMNENHPLSGIDLTKAVSNELIRLKDMGKIECVGDQPMPLGRPVRLYKKRYCQDTLSLLSSHKTSRKLVLDCGRASLFLYGLGMVPILKGLKVNSMVNGLELLDHHLQKVENNC
jgi:hypothetical protein